MPLENRFPMAHVSAFSSHRQHGQRIEYQSTAAVVDGDAIAGLNVGVLREQRAEILDDDFFPVIADVLARLAPGTTSDSFQRGESRWVGAVPGVRRGHRVARDDRSMSHGTAAHEISPWPSETCARTALRRLLKSF